jgi:c-di-GMP-binding flagellar brake protein YcgR
MTDSFNSELQRRRHPRLRAPVSYSPPRFYGPPRIVSQKRPISDISLGGARIFSDEPLLEGKGLQFELFLPLKKAVTASARVVWVKELPPGSEARYDVGLEFIYLPPPAMDELRTILGATPSSGF